MATADLIGSEKSGIPVTPQPPGARDFKRVFGYSYPKEMEDFISKTIAVHDLDGDGDGAVYTGYKFSGLLQRFLLDYTVKVQSGLPLSDEVRQDVNTPL